VDFDSRVADTGGIRMVKTKTELRRLRRAPEKITSGKRCSVADLKPPQRLPEGCF